MSSYYIDIVDTTTDTKVLVEEDARANSIVLAWNGADAKDDVLVVDSNLSFDIKAPNLSMGHFIHLFTANETKYRVDFRADDDDRLLWQGFLLPDSYNEDFTNNNPFVSLTASDGLGRLKGKYLPENYYTDEVSVISVIQACLNQTGLDLGLFFSPAIIHISKKKYHEIYIDGLLLFTSGKKKNCYDILTELLESMVCCLFQSLGSWYVEGLNVRHLTTVVYDEYEQTTGDYLGEVEVGRRLKLVANKALLTPSITMVPVYKTISVEYDVEQPKLPDNIVTETNDGWSAGAYDFIYADAFFPHGGASFAIATLSTEYKVRFHKNYSTPDPGRYMSLVTPVYVDVSQEVSIEIDFNYTILTAIINDKTTLKVVIKLNDAVLFETELYNNPYLEDEDEQTLTTIKEAFNITTSGFLDVFIYEPVSDGDARLTRDGWELNTFKITVINQDETYYYEDIINEDYSSEKALSIVYADEFSGLNPSFLIEKLRDSELTTSYEYQIEVLNEFESGGYTYLQVPLKDANICDSFQDYFYVNDVKVNLLEVVYNWLGSTNEYMLKIAAPTSGADVHVLIVKQNYASTDRALWQSWVDAVYKIDPSRYGATVVNLYRRMFLEPFEKIDFTVNALVNFNDLLVFKFITMKRFVPINLSIDLDSGKSTVSVVLNSYQDAESGTSDNIPPILTVKPDFCIPASERLIYLTSEAYDPDGFLVNHSWKITTPADYPVNYIYPTGSDSTNAPNVVVTGLPLEVNEYVFECSVTDNGGATVTKVVTVCRVLNTVVNYMYSCGQVSTGVVVPPYRTTSTDVHVTGTQYQKGVVFSLPETLSTDYNFVVNLLVSALVCSSLTLEDPLDVACDTLHDVDGSGRGEPFVKAAGIKVFKNGVKVSDLKLFGPDNLESGLVSFPMNASDEVLIIIGGYYNGTDYVNTKVDIDSMEEITGAITVSNTDIELYLTSNFILK